MADVQTGQASDTRGLPSLVQTEEGRRQDLQDPPRVRNFHTYLLTYSWGGERVKTRSLVLTSKDRPKS